ncbi:hypothetical protein Tco_1041719 [Tanacetum coccineum]|uniref:Uncharacterized protein n=1 Tax=Tanacetum coccineum TaxID=301880 RepID=A0ABQ5GHP7_9ASTR
MLGSAPSGHSFLVSPSVKLSVAGRGGAGKGGSRVLIPDLVVMAKVGASGFGVSFLLIAKRWVSYPLCMRLLFEHEVGELVLKLASDSPFGAILPFFLYVCCSLMVRCRRSDRTSEGKGHHRCLPRIGIPVRPGQVVCIHRPREILRSSRRLVSEMEKMFMGGGMSSHRSSWYWTYSSIRIHPSSSMSRESTILPVCSVGTVIGFWKPEDVGRECSCKVLGGVDGLGPVLLDEEASSSKRFLLAIARDSF